MYFITTYQTEIVFIIFLITILTLLVYYLLIFRKFTFHKSVASADEKHIPVSIVITSKNEAYYLKKTLPLLLTQEYTDYEIVIVNDNSNDDTNYLVKYFNKEYPNIKLVDLSSSVTNIKGKKFPIAIGIKEAKYEHILLTTASCYPSSKLWLRKIAGHFNNNKIILGFNTFETKPNIINILIHFDIFHTAIQYFSYHLVKMSFMGMGGNLAFTKSLFFDNKGFASHNHLAFGEDTLFVNKVATASNCTIEYAPEAHTYQSVKPAFRFWKYLKSNQIQSKKYFQKKHRLLLSLYQWNSFFFYTFFILSLCFSLNKLPFLITTLSLFMVKLIVQYVIFGFAASKLNEKRIVPYILIFDLLFAILNPFLYLFSRTKLKL